MTISIFDLFSIGIGPSSSHTVGPMQAAFEFIETIARVGHLDQVQRIQIDLFGSLALTGKGHSTDKAIINGLSGEEPHRIDPDTVISRFDNAITTQRLLLRGQHTIRFDGQQDLLFHTHTFLPLHSNAVRFSAYDRDRLMVSETYYSLGGGFIATEAELQNPTTNTSIPTPPFPFETAHELLTLCQTHKKSVRDIMWENELTWRDASTIRTQLLAIAETMHDCIEKGSHTPGILPGGLQVRRRAPELLHRLQQSGVLSSAESFDIMNWLNLFAMAVNEENAAGGRIVTAPTNGAAGVIPAVLEYYRRFHKTADEKGILTFLLTAGAMGILYKKGASISAAEVGCQGEVGVACSMAAAGLTAALGGNKEQIENAAEIGMEHHLGLTCDPIKGLVQIPCIERNAMGAVQAVNSARLALMEDGQHVVSLDKVIATMLRTGKDMQTIYKETSLGGLAAVNQPEC